MNSKLLTLLFLISTIITFGQSMQTDIPKLTPQSPQSDNLGRYGEVAVGEYTGAANISIPLHTIKSGALEFPLNLSYNSSSGVRVSQEATWVGLGWDLSVIAGITYVPAGGNDQMYPMANAISWSLWQKLIHFVNPICAGPLFGHESYTTDPVQTPAECVHASTTGVGERDLYSVNTPEFSFKFYIHPETGLPQIYGERNDFQITGKPDMVTGFTIVTGQGIHYYFKKCEDAPPFGVINAWYLTEIRNLEGQSILFTYTDFGPTKVLPPISETVLDKIDALQGQGARSTSVPLTERHAYTEISTINTKYLTSIESLTEIVRFKTSGRSDLGGVGARKLDSLIIEDKFSPRKKIIEFQHSYFTGDSNIGGDYTTDGTVAGRGTLSEDNIRKRLKLTGILERNTTGTANNKKYSFTYNEAYPLPMKTSFAVDHWGFYNGQENMSDLLHAASAGSCTRTLVPSLFSVLLYDNNVNYNDAGVDLYRGANRGASSKYMGCGMLKSITYPTGGRTEFTFEPHTFQNRIILSAEDEVIQSTPIGIYIYDLNYTNGSAAQYTTAKFDLFGSEEIEFLVHFHNKQGTFTYNQISSASFTLRRIEPNPGIVHTWTPSYFPDITTYGERTIYNEGFDDKLTLPAGKYIVSVNVPDELGFQGYSALAEGNFRYRPYPTPQVPSNYQSIGGGLRIKTIDNYNEKNVKVASREYTYLNTDSLSSGKLQIPLKYISNETYFETAEGTVGYNYYYNCTYRNSNNTLSLSTSPLGAIVGYSRVVIKDNDLNQISSNGMTIKEFTNETPLGTFGNSLIINDGLLAGNLIATTYLNQSGDTLRVEKNKYYTTAYEKDCINVSGIKLWLGGDESYAWDRSYKLGVYAYSRYKTNLIKKTEITYSGSNKNTIETEYDYNASFLVTETRSLNSKRELNVTRYKYPVDFISENSIYATMISDNIHLIEPVIEEINLKNNVQLIRKKTNYNYSLGYIKPFTVEQQVRNNPTEVLLTYDLYPNGNIGQYHTKNNIYNSFIWGYNRTLPIASVVHATTDEIFYDGFEGDVSSNVITTESKTGRKSYLGLYTHNISYTNNGLYTLTYWLKTSEGWVLKTNKVTVTNNSYIISINEIGAIDDVRFHPERAMMTTYTYDPIVGLTSSTDPNNVITYYEYDTFNRLKLVKDANKKIVKQNQYHYLNQQ